MELNNMDILSDEFYDIVERVFGDKIDDIVFDDIVDEPNRHTTRLTGGLSQGYKPTSPASA
ncbi:hypothetical protein V470_10800 [Streptococcus sp. VT 162]|nr:hypothetical protein V470_10800 [Streptococcus sp. VT 162]